MVFYRTGSKPANPEFDPCVFVLVPEVFRPGYARLRAVVSSIDAAGPNVDLFDPSLAIPINLVGAWET
jgi:hypothetical protein